MFCLVPSLMRFRIYTSGKNSKPMGWKPPTRQPGATHPSAHPIHRNNFFLAGTWDAAFFGPECGVGGFFHDF